MFALYFSFVQLLPCVSPYVSIRLCVAVYVQERREVVVVWGGGDCISWFRARISKVSALDFIAEHPVCCDLTLQTDASHYSTCQHSRQYTGNPHSIRKLLKHNTASEG